jgi:hypothetical protein
MRIQMKERGDRMGSMRYNSYTAVLTNPLKFSRQGRAICGLHGVDHSDR